MGDWLELAQSVLIALIFAFMLAKLISIVISFRDENLRITRSEEAGFTPETAEATQIPEEIQSAEEKECIAKETLENEGKIEENEGEALEERGETREDSESDGDEPSERVYETLRKGGETLAGEGLEEESRAGRFDEESHLSSDDDDWEGVESTELDEAFGAAASYVASMAAQSSERIPNDVQLQFYGFYKLATEGPCTVPPPSALKMTARAKWHAWQSLGTMSPEAAMQKYVALLTEIRPSWADGMNKKNRKQEEEKQEEESSHQSATRGGIGPVFSTFVNNEESDDETKLEIIHSYASEGDVTGLLQLLEQGITIDLRDSQGRTALHWAADRGQLKIAETLVSKGADINAKDMEGQTPLHYAFVCEREDIAKYLIDHGADATIEDNDGDAPRSICPKKWTWMSSRV
uniref:ACB domain-containing protein n=1 Tax=Araucaria cunninghamii TaxID=56994 RepID=A0A0D6R2R2_ARACU